MVLPHSVGWPPHVGGYLAALDDGAPDDGVASCLSFIGPAPKIKK